MKNLSAQSAISSLTYEEFFRGLPAEIPRIFEKMQIRSSYPSGSILFAEGAAAAGIFLISAGSVRLSISALGGESQVLKVAGPGDILGLNAAVTGKPYEATAQAVTCSQVSFVGREDLLLFLREHAEAAFRIIQLFSDHLGASLDQLRSLPRSRPRAPKS